MNKQIKDIPDEELKKLFKMSSRQVGSTIRSKMIIEELIKRSFDWNEDESIINQRQDMSKDQLSKLLKQEKEWTATFDSDVRVGLALLDEIRKLNQNKEDERRSI